ERLRRDRDDLGAEAAACAARFRRRRRCPRLGAAARPCARALRRAGLSAPLRPLRAPPPGQLSPPVGPFRRARPPPPPPPRAPRPPRAPWAAPGAGATAIGPRPSSSSGGVSVLGFSPDRFTIASPAFFPPAQICTAVSAAFA